MSSVTTSRDVTVPLLIGLGVAVATTAVVAHVYYYRKNKQREASAKWQLVTLQDPDKEYKFPLIHREDINHDTRLYRFGLPSSDHILGLPVGQHIFISADINGERVCRKYTPVTSDETRGYVDLVIKVYYRNVHPQYPEGGKLTQHIDGLKLGETIDVKGPTGRLKYTAPGKFDILLVKIDPTSLVIRRATKVAMIAGGSGIAPMLQLVRQVLRDPNDHTEMTLLFANQSEDDILLRKELDECEQKHPKQFKVWYTVDKASNTWQYSVGYVSAEMIRDHLFAPSSDTIMLICGPKPMITFACTPNLDKLGYDPKLRFIY